MITIVIVIIIIIIMMMMTMMMMMMMMLIIIMIIISNSSLKHLTLSAFAQQNTSRKYLEIKNTICSLKLQRIILNKSSAYAFSERGIFLEKKYLAP